MENKKLESAFPVHGFNDGMTLRDYFAASAVSGIIANKDIIDEFSNDGSTRFVGEDISYFAYKIADCMLREREK